MSIIDNAKEVVSLVKKLDDIELYRKIVELEGEIIELIRTNRNLEERLAEIQTSQETIGGLKFHSPFYVCGETNEIYCARCIETDHIAVHVVETTELKMRRRIWECPQCKAQYADMRKG